MLTDATPGAHFETLLRPFFFSGLGDAGGRCMWRSGSRGEARARLMPPMAPEMARPEAKASRAVTDGLLEWWTDECGNDDDDDD